MKPEVYACDTCGTPVKQKPGPGRIRRTCSEHGDGAGYYTRRPEPHCDLCGAGTGHPLRRRCDACKQPQPRTLSTTYDAVHQRLWSARGPAKGYACGHCSGQAETWAYDHQDPDELTQRRRGRDYVYSLDLDRYIPLCRSCHVKLDGNGYEGGALQRINVERQHRSVSNW